MDKLLYRVEEVCILTGLGRTKVYEEIAAKRLGAVHFGKSIRIPVEELRGYIDRARHEQSLAISDGKEQQQSDAQEYALAVCSICEVPFDWRSAGLKRHPKAGRKTYCASCRAVDDPIRLRVVGE